MPSAAADFQTGSEFAGYRIEGRLGRGGMGAVYLATHLRLKRKVALKVLLPELAQQEDFRARFIRESQVAASFEHPNVIPVYEADEEDGVLYLAMRYVEGSDVKSELERDGRLELDWTLSVVEQTARALDAAHAHDLVHRDVKPANILITDSGRHVYLTDFGIARPVSTGGLTRTGFFVGTIDYAPPEQIESKPVTPAVDVYALGCMAFECLAGEPPFRRETDIAVIHAHLLDVPPKLSERRPELPAALDGVVARAMAKSPAARFSTCGELAASLRSARGADAREVRGLRDLFATKPSPVAGPTTVHGTTVARVGEAERTRLSPPESH